jgi:hypothetical protein
MPFTGTVGNTAEPDTDKTEEMYESDELALGAVPAPPPSMTSPAGRTAEDAHVVALLKYTTPPDVPATVNAGVVVGVATEIKPPVKDTLVTVP